MAGGVPQAARHPFIGTVVSSEFYHGVSYRLEHLLGEGGTAVAYLATRQSMDGQSPVVIKIIQPRLVAESGERAVTIIKQEAVALGRLNERLPPSQSIVRLLDTGTLDYDRFGTQLTLPWLALEYVHGGVEGSTLYDRVEYAIANTGYAFDPERAARAIESLAEGLDDIHEAGIVHRDLSPGNVLCCGAGESELFKISDFGIARPEGLAQTFGDATLGTPGYLAPEQCGAGELGPHSDIFSFSAVVFFLLTGEHYFKVNNAIEAYSTAQAPTRRSILDTRGLCPELRQREVACHAIDLALARATAAEPRLRPQTARQFAASLTPWISEPSSSVRPSQRWFTSIAMLSVPEPAASTHWTVLHPPGGERLIHNAAWNASGHCLALTDQGLAYWDRVRWAAAPLDARFDPRAVRFVRRLGPASFLLGGDAGRLLEYSPRGTEELAVHPDRRVRLLDATSDFDDLVVAIGSVDRSPPLLCALVGNRWLKPLPVPHAAALNALARVEDERWLVVGRGVDGRGFAALYSPLAWEYEPLGLPETRALVACASRPERRTALGAGADGAVLRFEAGQLITQVLPGSPHLSAVATDTLGRDWAAAAGRMFLRRQVGDWSCVWADPHWTSPFVSVMAEVGFVAALTVDGGLIEYHAQADAKTRPAFSL